MKKLRLKVKGLKSLKLKTKTTNKYGNIPINGFDSKSEYYRWCVLSGKQKKGEISNLRHHVLYRFPDGKAYEADFVYTQGGKTVVEDVKNPLLRVQYKFLSNCRKMRLHYNLNVLAIHPQTQKTF